ncbi:hypothetical protein F5X97DRAFT_327873 [Nemania serpens]|nr:hypothetical protein F5X97DRAFT_327873 [Nemania serpens]
MQNNRLVTSGSEPIQVVSQGTFGQDDMLSASWPKLPTPTPTPRGEPSSTPSANDTWMSNLKRWIESCESHRSIDAYYSSSFHKAHPFAPTKKYMQSRIQSQDASAIPLYAAMSYVGCMYQKSSLERDLKSLALSHTYPDGKSLDVPTPQNIYQVATLLLVSIVTLGNGEMEQAGDYLAKAASLSIDIGMDHAESLGGNQDTEFTELWKRTYWYLFIMAEALQDMGDPRDFRLDEPALDFPLPCSDDPGGSCEGAQDSSSMTLTRFDLADFEDQGHVFSSLTYLIALVRISQAIKKLDGHPNERDDRAVVRANGLLMNWKLHLPAEKQRVVTKSGEIDEIMLQSHLMFFRLRIFVHTSLSDLSADGNERLHARARFEAADSGVSLLTLHPSLTRLSPLNIKQLSRCAEIGLKTAAPAESDFNARDHLRLVLGALKQVSVVWKTAELESRALKSMARTAYCIPSPRVQVEPKPTPATSIDLFSGEVDFQIHDTVSLGQPGDAGITADQGNASTSMPLFEGELGALDDTSVFSWQL